MHATWAVLAPLPVRCLVRAGRTCGSNGFQGRWRTPMFLSLCLCFSAPLPAQQVQELLWEKLGAALEQLQRGWGHQF